MIEVGAIFKTSYSYRVYKVKKLRKGCTCPDEFNNFINGLPNIERAPHIHIYALEVDADCKVIRTPEANGWFNAYDYETLKHLSFPDDHLILLDMKKVQLTLF